MKKLLFVAIAFFCVISFGEAYAATEQFGQKTTVSAKVENGNAVVAWTDPLNLLKVAKVEHYIGHGKKSGFIDVIRVGDAKSVVLKDLKKNGGRFNLVTTTGKYLHLECGGNDRTVMPTLVGLTKNCSFEVNGQKVGAIEVQ